MPAVCAGVSALTLNVFSGAVFGQPMVIDEDAWMSGRKAWDVTLGLVPPRAVNLQLYFSVLVEVSRINTIELNLEPSHGSGPYCGLHHRLSFFWL